LARHGNNHPSQEEQVTQPSPQEAGSALVQKGNALLNLARTNRGEAEQAFARLTPQDALALVRSFEARDRLDLIYLAEDCTDLVRALRPEELYLTVKSVGHWDALEAIETASDDQINFLLDHECWTKDRINQEAVIDWIQLFLDCSDDQCARIIRGLHPEFVIAAVKGHVRLNHRGIRSLQVDDQFFCTPDALESDQPTIKEFLFRLYDVDLEYFARLMRLIVTMPKGRAEADAHGDRELRLREAGFPGYLESQMIYDPVDLRLIEQERGQGSSPAKPTSSPAVAGHAQQLFLQKTIEHGLRSGLLSNRFTPRVEEQVGRLTNRILVADEIDPTEKPRVLAALERARQLVNLGLEFQSNQSLDRAVLILIGCDFEFLFRIGHTLVSRLQKRADHIGGGLSSKVIHGMLVPPYKESFQGLMGEQILLYRRGCRPEFSPIRSIRDYEEAADRIAEIDLLVQLHMDILPIRYRHMLNDPRIRATAAVGPLTLPQVAKKNLDALVSGELGLPSETDPETWLDQLLIEHGFNLRDRIPLQEYWRTIVATQRSASG
jgi:hypothetical protein